MHVWSVGFDCHLNTCLEVVATTVTPGSRASELAGQPPPVSQRPTPTGWSACNYHHAPIALHFARTLLPYSTVNMAAPVSDVADSQRAQTLGSTDMEVPPLLVQVLGGNVVTTAAVLACLNTTDATVLRRLHPALAAAVAAVPWADAATPARDIARWRAALPAAVALKLAAGAPLLQQGEKLASLHLIHLCVLIASRSNIDAAVIASLPPSLHTLDLSHCNKLSSVTSFAHLPCLHTLNLHNTSIGSAILATLPPSLTSLDLRAGTIWMFAPATVLPHLPALRVLNVSNTGLGDATVASMPAGLEELTMVGCRNVTRHARLDHLAALRVLNSIETDLSRATIAACRARGCFAPADGGIAPIDGWQALTLVPLPDGRLVCGGWRSVGLLEATAGRTAVARLEFRGLQVSALAVLHDGHRVAIGMSRDEFSTPPGCPGIVVWDTRHEHIVFNTTIACASGVRGLAVAANGHLVAGCEDGKLLIVDVSAGAVVTTVAAHTGPVMAVAVLLDGRVASASSCDCNVLLWDVGTGTCVSTLVGHTHIVKSLAVLSDGRLVSGSCDHTVRLWDTVSGTSIRVLTGHSETIRTLTPLPGDQLASVSIDGTVCVWDTGGAGGALARPLVIHAYGITHTVVPLPGNRLATGGESVQLWQLPPRACRL